ncbi:MAG TPA: hypothetical protein VMB34_01795 [Acetobacteraceae bacterium]|nr:hypothetical protein [Acetobacteraceae bacterium]
MATVDAILSLDKLGMQEATDKCGLDHDYLRHYDRAFAQWRDSPINLIEIGVMNGASARMWKRYFRCAQIIGIDIKPDCKQFEEDRVRIEIGSQTDKALLVDVAERYPPTIVIDDGSHIAEHIGITLEALFPKLLSGGCYVIEDTFVHAGPDLARWRGSTPFSPQDHVVPIARQLMDGRIGRDNMTDLGLRLTPQIDRIEMATGVTLIWKKQASATMSLDELETLLRQTESARGWDLFAGYVVRRGGPKECAVTAQRRAIELDPSQPFFYQRLSHIYHYFGDIDNAIEAMTGAIRLASGPGRDQLEDALKALQTTSPHPAR